jgi:hypothetical protein
MTDGKTISEYPIENIEFNPLSACYDLKNNMIWTYEHQLCRVSVWSNPGLVPDYTFPSSDGDVVMSDVWPTTTIKTIVNNTNIASSFDNNTVDVLPPLPKYAPESLLKRDEFLLKNKVI